METNFFTPIDVALFESRIVQLSGPVDSKLAYRVNRALLALEKADSKLPIYLHIDSPGGEIYSGFSIFDTIRFIQPKVITVVCGLAASMGSVIALAAKKENRIAFPNSKFLIHQPLSGMHGQASDIEIHARDLLKTKEKINQLYALETGRPIEEIREMTDRDHWLDAEEAIKLGLISKVVTKRSEI